MWLSSSSSGDVKICEFWGLSCCCFFLTSELAWFKGGCLCGSWTSWLIMLTYRRQWCHISTSQGACVAMFALYCWASIDFYWGTQSQKKKKREDKVFSSTHTRHWFFFFFFSVSSSKGGRNGDGCRSYRLSILSVEPCVKEKQVFFSFFFSFAAFILSVLCCCSVCVRRTGFNHEALCLIFCPYMHTIHPSIQHSNAST